MALATNQPGKVPENDRLIRKPEALLTLLLDTCYAWTETAPDQRGETNVWKPVTLLHDASAAVSLAYGDGYGYSYGYGSTNESIKCTW